MRSIRKVAWIELKLQTRAPLFWVTLLIVIGYNIAVAFSVPREELLLRSFWLDFRNGALAWQGAALIFLIPTTLIHTNRIFPLLWMTGVHRSQLILGKLCSVWLLVLLIASVDLSTQVTLALIRNGTSAIAQLPIFELPSAIVISALLFLSTLYFFIAICTGARAFITYVVCAVIFTVCFFRVDTLNPLTLYPFEFESDMIGFGPESVIIAHRTLLYLTFVPLITVAALITYRFLPLMRSERKYILLGGCVSLLITGIGIFQYGGSLQQNIRPVGLIPPISNEVMTDVVAINVETRFSSSLDHLEGQVEVIRENPTQPLHLHVPPGLRVVSITDCEQASLDFEETATTLIAIQPMDKMCLSFAGYWSVWRYTYDFSYDFSYASYFNASTSMHNQYAYILPQAHWYPAPLNETIPNAQVNVQIAVPSQYQIFSTADEYLTDSDAYAELRWKGKSSQVYIGLIAGKYIQTNNVYTFPHHAQFATDVGTFYQDILDALNEYVDIDKSYQIIEVPVLVNPMIVDNMVLLPEGRFQQDLKGIRLDQRSEALTFQNASFWIVRGWLLGSFEIKDVCLPNEHLYVNYQPIDSLVTRRPTPDGLALYASMSMTDAKYETTLVQQGTEFYQSLEQSPTNTTNTTITFPTLVPAESSHASGYFLRFQPETIQTFLQTIQQQKLHTSVTRNDVFTIMGDGVTNNHHILQEYYDDLISHMNENQRNYCIAIEI